jgi:hypothetical protein
VEIDLLLVHIELENYTDENKKNIDGTLALLDHLLLYIDQLDSDQKDSLRYYTGIACFCNAGLHDEKIYYQRANAAFDNVLKHAHTSDVSDHLLDSELYKEILYYKIYSLYNLYEYENISSVIDNFLKVCGWNETEKTYNNPIDKQRISNILLIQ